MPNDYNHLVYSGNHINETFLTWFSQQDPLAIDLRGGGLNTLFRDAVRHQTSYLWQQLEDKPQGASLDHYPVHFSALKWIFIKLQGFNPHQFRRTDVTAALLREWQSFHGTLAEYRLIDRRLNYLLGRWHSSYWEGLTP